jgi:protein-L-isoaspartate O-methyltransferase
MTNVGSEMLHGLWTDSLKPILRPWLAPMKRALLVSRQGIAFVLRKLTFLFEKLNPPLGRKMRNWSWIWQSLYSPKFLKKFYEQQEDPHNLQSPYETEKYAHCLRLLGGKTYRNALEVGAAEGIFTKLLAPHCASVLAIELVDIAVERAKLRLKNVTNVSFIQASLPGEMPDGSFDLIVASDILLLFPKDVLKIVIARFEEALEPDGILFCLNYLGEIGASSTVHNVEKLLKNSEALEVTHEETVADVGPGGKGYSVIILKKLDGRPL